MKKGKLNELKETFGLEEIPSKLEQSIKPKHEVKLQINKRRMKKVIETKSGRLNDVLSAFIEKESSDFKISTGFKSLDKLMGGLHLGELIVVGARPSHGKTSFLLSLAYNISFRKNPTPVLYINLESTLRHTAERMALMLEEDNALNNAPFFISAPENDFESILKEIQIQIKSNKVKVILIDYIQLLRVSEDNQRNRGLTSALRTLKQIVAQEEVSVVIASQLNRSVELRSGYMKRPYLSDLRDSGALEQESDKVIFLNRLECYGITENQDGESSKGIVEIMLSKNRSGFMGELILQFAEETASFKCWPSSKNNWGELNTDLVF